MKSSQAQAASAIRKELKTAFPGVKFSVTSDSGSMTTSVRIAWTDGPTVEMVEEYTKKYQYGHFDGMQDLYEYSNRREDIPQAKYVFEERSMSEATKARIIAEHNARFCEAGQINDLESWNEDAQEWNGTLVHRKFYALNLFYEYEGCKE